VPVLVRRCQGPFFNPKFNMPIWQHWFGIKIVTFYTRMHEYFLVNRIRAVYGGIAGRRRHIPPLNEGGGFANQHRRLPGSDRPIRSSPGYGGTIGGRRDLVGGTGGE
jgi:hypothetical protein